MNLKNYRKKLGLTQTELGNKLNTTPSTISKWESGSLEPGIYELRQLSSLFNVSIDDLLKRDVVKIKTNTSSKLSTASTKQKEVFKLTLKEGKYEDHGSTLIKRPFYVLNIRGFLMNIASLIWFCISGATLTAAIVLLTLAATDPETWSVGLLIFFVIIVIVPMFIILSLTTMHVYTQDDLFSHALLSLFAPFVHFFRIFKVDWKPGDMQENKTWHNDKLLVFADHIEIISYNGHIKSFKWNEVLNINIPLLDKHHTTTTPVTKSYDAKVGRNKVRVNVNTNHSHTVHYKENGGIEMLLSTGRKIRLINNSDSRLSDLTSIWKLAVK